MGRKVRDSRLETREARLKLKEKNEPYWRLIHEGLHLGYRKGNRTGTWVARGFDKQKKGYLRKSIGTADDTIDSNGIDILTFKEAQSKALEIAPEFNLPTNKPLTVGDAAKHYLKWYKENRKAYRSTEVCIQAHILPIFETMLVSKLTSKHIRDWLTKLAEQPARKRTSQLREQQYHHEPTTPIEKRARKATANRILSMLKAMLNKAYYDELVSDNAAWCRIKPFGNVDEPVIRFLKEDECKRLINASRPDFRELINAALFTGARYGELIKLRAEDVNLENRSILIKDSKNNKSRHIPLSAEGFHFFNAITTGKLGAELVFLKKTGTPWGKSHQARLLKEACQNAKITPAISFHELRHTYASLLAQYGADLLNISKLLGHADTRITSRHYAHLCDKTLANTVNSLLPNFGYQIENKIRRIA